MSYKTTLYQKDKKGKIRVWTIYVQIHPEYTPIELSDSYCGKRIDGFYFPPQIVVESGILGGKMTKAITPVPVGKNIGKANETSPSEQARLDMQTEINKKKKAGYVENIEDAKEKDESATIKKPMKAYDYHPECRNKACNFKSLDIEYQKIGIQPKLDGWRYRIKLSLTGCTFYTSSGDETMEFPQISSALYGAYLHNMFDMKYPELILDGEIYNHSLSFNDIASACGTTKHITEEKQALRDKMQFHIFDVCLPLPYEERLKIVSLFHNGTTVRKVQTIDAVAYDRDMEFLFDSFLQQGYEGLIIRVYDGKPYQYTRTKSLLKYKPLMDDEFKIVGFKESIETGTLGSLVCEMPDGRTFDASLKGELGSDKMKLKIWNNQSDYLGIFVTVEFLEYTEYGMPRHPRAKCFRKYHGSE